jgi:hypothetical protein
VISVEKLAIRIVDGARARAQVHGAIRRDFLDPEYAKDSVEHHDRRLHGDETNPKSARPASRKKKS